MMTTKKNKRTNALFYASWEGSLENVVTNQGVVTRRATLGKRLTFLDVVCVAEHDQQQRQQYYYLKVTEPNVTKRIRVGATVRFRGKEYDHDASGRRGERTKGVYVETEDVPELLDMAPASMVVNARKFLADLDGKNTSSSSLSGAVIFDSSQWDCGGVDIAVGLSHVYTGRRVQRPVMYEKTLRERRFARSDAAK